MNRKIIRIIIVLNARIEKYTSQDRKKHTHANHSTLFFDSAQTPHFPVLVESLVPKSAANAHFLQVSHELGR